jgi:hypothetical protein
MRYDKIIWYRKILCVSYNSIDYPSTVNCWIALKSIFIKQKGYLLIQKLTSINAVDIGLVNVFLFVKTVNSFQISFLYYYFPLKTLKS